MATAVSIDGSVALSVSADHLIGRYDLNVRNPPHFRVPDPCHGTNLIPYTKNLRVYR